MIFANTQTLSRLAAAAGPSAEAAIAGPNRAAQPKLPLNGHATAGTCGTLIGLIGCWALLSAAPVSHADNLVGGWQSASGNNWPMIPIHATLTPDGRVVTYGSQSNGKQSGYFFYDVWDPQAGLAGGHLTLPNQTQTDIFCSAQVVLPQSGSIFLAGGDTWNGSKSTNVGNNNTNLFDYTDNTLTRGNNLNRARWYSTITTLVNGEVYIQGGNGGADFPEVRDTSGNFRLLTGARTSAYWWDYPRDFVAPDGRVFGFDNLGHMYYVATGGLGSVAGAGTLSSTYTALTASAVMYQPGKILQFGGKWNGALIIDLNAMKPSWHVTGQLSTARQWVNGTVLADGRVLATGGSAVANTLTGVNNAAEIWNPATGTWVVGASSVTPRLYHSIALLLPDASVLVGGGGAPGPLTNLNAEIYYPPYLYTSDGAVAARPSIDSAPDALDIGQQFTMDVTASSVSRVTLVKTGAVTHSFNMDQRFLELPFTATNGQLSVLAPQRASDATPGYYLLFAIDGNGVPSVGKIVKVNIQPDSLAPTPPASPALTMPSGKPTLTWNPSTDNVGVAGYIINRSTDGTVGPEVLRTLAMTWVDSTVTAGTTYTYQIEAYDVAGNVSPAYSPLTVTVYRAPTNFTATLVNGHPLLSWSVSTDVGVSGYSIYRSTKGTLGAKVASTSTNQWSDTKALRGVTYTYGVKANDVAGRYSAPSALVRISVP
jgi:galactose oxidase-like protein